MLSNMLHTLPLYIIGARGGAGFRISNRSDLPVYQPSGHPLVSVTHVYPGLDPQPIQPGG